MANTTLSANMLLPIPTIGVDPGPDWALNINSCLQQIDQHTHLPNAGVPITPAAININADLPFNTYSASGLKSVQFVNQASLTNLNSVYVKGNELYFNDGVGSPAVQITKAGAVNATSSGISNGTATASFVSSVLVVNAATNTPANIQGASLLLGNNLAGTNYLTLSPPNAMASNYALNLPTIPAVNSFLTIDTSGNIAGSVPILGSLTASNLSPSANITGSQLSSSADIVGSQLSPTAGILGSQLSSTAGILGTQIGGSTIAKTNLQPLGQQVSGSSGLQIKGTNFLWTFLSVSITTTGRPVMIVALSDGSGTPAFIYAEQITIARGGVQKAVYDGTVGNLPPSAISFIDTPTAGTYVYQLQGYGTTTGPAIGYTKLLVYEL